MEKTKGSSREHPIIRFANFIDHSTSYKNAKKAVDRLLHDQNCRYKRYFDLFIIFLILSSVTLLIYEVKHPLPLWMDYYDIYFVSLVFLIEYILRLWVYSDMSTYIVKEYKDADFIGKEFKVWSVFFKALKRKLSYVVTPAAIIDILAIMPAYRPLRVLRIFVLFRFLKLLRYTRSANQFVDVLASKRFELLTLLFLLLFVVFTGGIAIYVLEETHNPNIETIFDALYWSLVTISTVGYGDISPVSDLGRLISVIIIIFGIAMISFATSVIVSAFSEKLSELKEERIIEEVNKSHEFLIICGYGQMAKMFLRIKDRMEFDYIILDKNEENVRQATHDGYAAIVDDASRFETLSRFKTAGNKVTVMCLSHDDIENIYITLNAKSVSPKIRVIARASNSEIVSKYQRAGADHILLPNEMAGTMMAVAITKPIMYKAIHAIFTGQNVALLGEIPIYKDSLLADKKIREIDFRLHKLVLIGIQKARSGSFEFNPDPETYIEKGDILLVMGKKISINYFLESNCVGSCDRRLDLFS